MRTHSSKVRAAVVLALLLTALTRPAGAAVPPGSLDPTFDGDGLVEIPADQPFLTGHINQLAVEAGGSVLVASGTYTGVFDTLLSRLDASGAVDPTFGNLGTIHLYTGSSPFAQVTGLAPAAGGAVLVAFGTTAGALERRTADGTLDPTFGTGGRRTDLAGASSLTVTPAGIVLVHDGKLRRVTSSGSDDATFGANGVAVLPRPIEAVAALTDGRLAASMPNPAVDDDSIVVLTPDGVVDPSFGNDLAAPGEAVVNVSPGGDFVEGVSGGPDGTVLVTATWFGSSGNTSYAARFTSDGTFDAAFGTGGSTLLRDSPTRQPFVGTPLVRPDGTSVIHIALGYGQDRVIDLSGSGAVTRETVLKGPDAARPMALEATGAVLLPLYGWSSTTGVARLTASGFDSTYSGDGLAFVGFPGPAYGAATAGVVLADGSLVSPVGGGGHVDIWRHRSDGTPESTFGDGGRVRLPTREDTAGYARVVADETSSLLYIFYSYGDHISRVARLLTDGSLDPSWGDAGVVSLETLVDVTDLSFLRLSPSGVFVVSYLWDMPVGGISAKILRLDDAGVIDSTFGEAGVTTITRPDGMAFPSDGVADPQGGLILNVGSSLVRVQPDGTLDPAFAGDGTYELLSTGCATAGLTPAPGPAALIYLATQVPNGCNDPAPATTVVALDVGGNPVPVFADQPSVTLVAGKQITGVAVDASRRILLAFTDRLVRVLPSGEMDLTFGNGGVAMRPAALTSGYGVTVGSSGLYLSGSSTNGGTTHAVMARLESGPPLLTVPGAPTIIKNATPGDRQATVSWTTPTYDGGSPITGYVVTPYIGYAPRPSTTFSSTSTTQTITGLTNGTTYRFRVRAINANGTGTYSKVTNPVTPG